MKRFKVSILAVVAVLAIGGTVAAKAGKNTKLVNGCFSQVSTAATLPSRTGTENPTPVPAHPLATSFTGLVNEANCDGSAPQCCIKVETIDNQDVITAIYYGEAD
jgi:L-asparaginase/Glu-tRNA(Gln) amidotransferase subunit D